MDQLMEDSFSRGYGAGLRRGRDVLGRNEALHLQIDTPGLGREDVKISVDENTLIIKAEAGADSDEEESGRRYYSRIELPQNAYKINEIKAEMKNGVLEVCVPKVKEEERRDVFHIDVQ
ncbi:hypothetical protein SAY87_014022 [Trapa incisa]|uniref:SHSP domain-containing protein n=1 Tax=Trapa incisa TaxID=236973 RepID=A0AAN7GN44_9MYRT|nr:hypothetical protein SAY87_014022 [Trapa incisa]